MKGEIRTRIEVKELVSSLFCEGEYNNPQPQFRLVHNKIFNLNFPAFE